MSVLSRPALEDSPLADLHTIATELGLDGFRRLRKADLIDRILERAGGSSAATDTADAVDADADAESPRPRRSRRGGRSRVAVDADTDTDAETDADTEIT